MSRRQHRVPVALDPKDVKRLGEEEIRLILRGADGLIGQGGRRLLAKVLKGSKDKKVLELALDQSPAYGGLGHLTVEAITARIDWLILQGYLDIEYDGRLPLLVYTPKGLGYRTRDLCKGIASRTGYAIGGVGNGSGSEFPE